MATESSKLLNIFFDSLASFSLDTVILIVLVTVFSAYAFYSGKRSATAFILGLIGAYSMYAAFSFRGQIVAELSREQAFWVNVVVFAIFFVMLNVVLRDVIHDDYPSGTMKFFQSIILGVVSTGLLLAYYYHLFGGQMLAYNFSSGIAQLFSAPMALFFWILGSVATVFFLERL